MKKKLHRGLKATIGALMFLSPLTYYFISSFIRSPKLAWTAMGYVGLYLLVMGVITCGVFLFLSACKSNDK